MDELSRPRVLAVAGPTATGKTSLSVFLAEQLNGEIISADSMQLYRGLDVGTAKVTPEEMHGIVHYGVNILSPDQPYSVAEFIKMAQESTNAILSRNKLPILAGGTGLYLESFLKGVRFSPDRADRTLRSELEKELSVRGADEMYAELQRTDPEAALAIHPNNTVRVLRALEHFRTTGQTMTEQKALSLPEQPPYRSLVFGLDFPNRQDLYARIDSRVDRMMENGLPAEAEVVYRNRDTYRTAAQAIGYKELFPYLAGELPLEPCVAKLKQASRNYAKRQLTWFRKMKDVVWLDAGSEDLKQQALDKARLFLKGEIF